MASCSSDSKSPQLQSTVPEVKRNFEPKKPAHEVVKTDPL
jgi:hypothetical protein